MDESDITYDDLLQCEEPHGLAGTHEELAAEGFPRGGGLDALAAIVDLPASNARELERQQRFRLLLEHQREHQPEQRRRAGA